MHLLSTLKKSTFTKVSAVSRLYSIIKRHEFWLGLLFVRWKFEKSIWNWVVLRFKLHNLTFLAFFSRLCCLLRVFDNFLHTETRKKRIYLTPYIRTIPFKIKHPYVMSEFLTAHRSWTKEYFCKNSYSTVISQTSK